MTVVALWRFPVKSMQGEQLETADVDERGIAGDRAYAFVDVETGRIASAKHPRKYGALFGCSARFVDEPTLGQPPPAAEITFPDGSTAHTTDDDLGPRISELIGREVVLVTSSAQGATLEEVWPDIKGDDRYGPEIARDGDDAVIDVMASFAVPGGLFDFSAIHLITTNTLDELSRREPDSVFDVRRFRPNIVVEVEGETGFVENEWDRAEVAIGETLRLNGLMPVARCVMTTLPQDDLPEDLGVLRATAEHNRIRAGGLGNLPCAGVYYEVAQPGPVAVGDTVQVDVRS